MATSADTELSEFIVNDVESDELAQELAESGVFEDGQFVVTPDEDEESSSIVVDYIVPSDTTQVNITGLDIIGDGNVYKISVHSPVQIGDWLYMRFNNRNDARYYDRYNTFQDNPLSVYLGSQSAFIVGAYPRIVNIILQDFDGNVSAYADGAGLVNGQYATFLTMGFSNDTTNITSIQLFSGASIPAGTRIIVRKTQYTAKGVVS